MATHMGGRRWVAIRAEVLERDGYRCQIRGPGCTGGATMVDHITPRRVGGGDSLDNLRGACSSCNIGRENRRRARARPRWVTSSSLAIALVLFTLGGALASARPAEAARANRAACPAIVAELRRQGASSAVAARFGRIAWRESGCVMQCVTDADDHSCSRFGINMRGNMPRYWSRLCGASSVNATKALRVDVRCALAAYRALGWRPWR